MRDHLMVGCDSLKVVILVRIQVPQLIEFVTKLRLDKFYQLRDLDSNQDDDFQRVASYH